VPAIRHNPRHCACRGRAADHSANIGSRAGKPVGSWRCRPSLGAVAFALALVDDRRWVPISGAGYWDKRPLTTELDLPVFVHPPVRMISIPLAGLALDLDEARTGCRSAPGH
jgi:hypothetical protein